MADIKVGDIYWDRDKDAPFLYTVLEVVSDDEWSCNRTHSTGTFAVRVKRTEKLQGMVLMGNANKMQQALYIELVKRIHE